VFGYAVIAASVAFSAPDSTALRAALDAHRAELEAKAKYQLEFTDAELAKVAKGEVAKRRERLKGTDRVMGLAWTPASMDAVWVAMQDPDHWNYVEGFLEEKLPSSTFNSKIVYQRILFPWPFADRQWVIEVKNNLALIEATNGKVWERTWSLNPERGAVNEMEKAIWVDINDGGWMVTDAGEGSLLGFHVRTVLGGSVPDELVVRYSMGTLQSLLGGLTERATTMTGHYDAAHTPVRRPDGTTIPPMD